MRKAWAYGSLALCILTLSGTAFAQQSTVYSYDVQGRLTAATASTGTTAAYAYDPANNRTGKVAYQQMTAAWEAEALPHQIGFAEAEGWAANIYQPGGFLTYGPYTSAVPTGARVAVWSLMIDNYTADAGVVAVIDVWDATAGEQLAVRNLQRNEWHAAMAYEIFELPFPMDSSRAGHLIEFRTWFVPIVHLRADRIGYR